MEQLPYWIGGVADLLVMVHIWAISLWVLGHRFAPQLTWLPKVLPWINALLLFSSLVYVVFVILAMAALSSAMHGSFLSMWYVWLSWVPSLCGLTMFVQRYRRSWSLGIALAVLNSLLPWLPGWIIMFLDWPMDIGGVHEVHWLTWLRNAVLLLALIVAISNWVQRRSTEVRADR
jgi:hypothetical protein